MSDMRDMLQGPKRKDLDDEHTAKMYALYERRSEVYNAVLSMLAITLFLLVLAALACLVAGVIWVWMVLL